ncbi:SpoIID/LytB domain-containing protein [Streptobacillus canis]|uniref:SpoIID/LytB domain-containing protein n=1 Tax=Streptobacillus canis TaxID=2678686 RepID=UPI0012E1BFE3|nr:SpoIID/LytB domain-containing protein [Streptobacillus canis]
MRKLRYILILLFIFSCSNIERTNTNRNQEIKVVSNKEVNLRDDIRVRLTNLEKNNLNIELDENMLLNENVPYSLNISLEGLEDKVYMDGNYYENITISNKTGIIKIGKYSFYGDMLIKSVDSKLILINTLNMEKYLLGVVPFEIPASFPIEALKAQTVIARSYAYRNIARNKKDFDVYDSTLSQVYQGIPTKNVDNVRKAIKETSGEVILYNNRIIDAVFHSYSGGYTASAKEVWGNEVEYLQAIEDNYSKGVHSTVLNWEFQIDKESILEKVGFEVFDYDISFTESNRVSKLILYNEDKSQEMQFTGNSFRKAFSLSKIKSTAFTIEINDRGIKVVGSGYGHGVGFSQWSSKTMATDHNMSYIDIINFFYRGVKVAKKGE